MKNYIKKFLSNRTEYFIKYAYIAGIIFSLFFYIIGTNFSTKKENAWVSALSGILINLSADFLMTGLTISVIDVVIQRNERRKYGNAPTNAKKELGNELRAIVAGIGFILRGTTPGASQQEIDEINSMSLPIQDSIFKMNILSLQKVDSDKVTLEMFNDILRYAERVLKEFDTLIDRYEAVLDLEAIAVSFDMRNGIKEVVNTNQLATITLPFQASQNPNHKLDKRQRATFEKMLETTIRVCSITFKP